MRNYFIILFALICNHSIAQISQFAMHNEAGRFKYLNYNNPMVLKFKSGCESKYPVFSYNKNSEKVVRMKFLFHSVDSFYFQDKVVIAYQDIDWFYIGNLHSITNKIISIGLFSITGLIIAASADEPYFLLGTPLVLLSFPFLNSLDKNVFYTKDWTPIQPVRTNYFYKQLDKNPRAIYP